MSSMKRVRLAALFLVATALMAGTPALAGNPISMTLTCVADETDQNYGASGTASLGNVKLNYVWAGPFDYYSYYSAALTVQCEGLTRGARYSVFVEGNYTAAFTATKTGTGGVKQWVSFFSSPPVVAVYREDSVDGAVQLVPVLEGW